MSHSFSMNENLTDCSQKQQSFLDVQFQFSAVFNAESLQNYNEYEICVPSLTEADPHIHHLHNMCFF